MSVAVMIRRRDGFSTREWRGGRVRQLPEISGYLVARSSVVALQ